MRNCAIIHPLHLELETAVCLVYLVDLVQFASFVQPNKQDKPNKPNNGLLMLVAPHTASILIPS